MYGSALRRYTSPHPLAAVSSTQVPGGQARCHSISKGCCAVVAGWLLAKRCTHASGATRAATGGFLLEPAALPARLRPPGIQSVDLLSCGVDDGFKAPLLLLARLAVHVGLLSPRRASQRWHHTLDDAAAPLCVPVAFSSSSDVRGRAQSRVLLRAFASPLQLRQHAGSPLLPLSPDKARAPNKTLQAAASMTEAALNRAARTENCTVSQLRTSAALYNSPSSRPSWRCTPARTCTVPAAAHSDCRPVAGPGSDKAVNSPRRADAGKQFPSVGRKAKASSTRVRFVHPSASTGGSSAGT